RGPCIGLANDRVGVGAVLDVAGCAGVADEVAIGAFRQAPREVHINAHGVAPLRHVCLGVSRVLLFSDGLRHGRRGAAMLQVDQLIERIRTYQPSVDADLIQRAYDYSYRMHAGQRRKSGQPYIVHPVSVAGIIADLRLDGASVCAGLLHDVVEDTLATTADLTKEFG